MKGGFRGEEQSMIDKEHLRGQDVVFLISGTNRPLQSRVVYVETDGIWLDGDKIVDRLTTAIGGAMELAGIKTPVVFIPFSQIQWLIASNV
jgi:hypothetical protein